MADMDLESMKKLDDLIKTAGGENPSRKQVLEMIESSGLAEEVKESLRSMVKGNIPQVFGSYGSGALLAVLFVTIVFAVIIVFGYKLYKSIKEKETKKEEKKKLKQLKKKK